MIEQALVEGVKIRWSVPTQVLANRDGSIVQSVKPANPLIYLGKARQPSHRLFHGASQGYQIPVNSPIPHAWLDYNPGHTSYITQRMDVLTGLMSGCLIARGSYLGNIAPGSIQVFHVGTIEKNNVNQCVKATFRMQMPVDTTGFNPAKAWSIPEREMINSRFNGVGSEVIALVTSGGTFFSVLLCRTNPSNEYVVGGIKRVSPIDYDGLNDLLL
jgi:hypothetical protein